MSDKSILIIDDNEGLLFLYRTILETEGYRTYTAQSGEAALELLRETPAPDLILIDCSMPRMSGEDFLLALEARFPEVVAGARILGFSSFHQQATMIRGFVTRVHGFVPKPSDIDEFVQMVRRELDDSLRCAQKTGA